MKRRSTIIATVAAAAVLAGAGFGIARAQGGDDDETDTPIGGAELDRASAAALASTGGGRVTGTEVNDEESYYEVEVTLNEGRRSMYSSMSSSRLSAPPRCRGSRRQRLSGHRRTSGRPAALHHRTELSGRRSLNDSPW